MGGKAKAPCLQRPWLRERDDRPQGGGLVVRRLSEDAGLAMSVMLDNLLLSHELSP